MCCFCNQRVHIAKVCKSRIVQSSQNKAPDMGDSSKATHQVTQDSCDTDSSEYTLYTLPCQQTKPLQTDIEIEGHNLGMEIDTEAAFSIISDRICTNLPYLEKLPLQLTQVTLQIYTGESIATCVRGAFSQCHLSKYQSHITSFGGHRGWSKPGLKVGRMTRNIWVTWVTFLVGQVGLICKLNYQDVTRIFNRSHVL